MVPKNYPEICTSSCEGERFPCCQARLGHMHPLDTNSGKFDVLPVSWNHPRPWSLFTVYDHPTNLLANRCDWFELPAASGKSAEVGL